MNKHNNRIDETGNKHGILTVIGIVNNEKIGTYWSCKCDCGNEIVVRASHLRSGHTRSCGCLQRIAASANGLIDEVGNRYGKLVVVRQVKDERRGAYWLCKCDCGNEKIASGSHLRKGYTNSCGCFLKSLPVGGAAFNAVYENIKRGAIRRGLVLDLTKEQVRILAKKPCYYCGCSPKQVSKSYGRGDFIYNGLDRIDNTIGYLLGNVVPCCKKCNFAKNTMPINVFREWIVSAYKHFGSKLYARPIHSFVEAGDGVVEQKEQGVAFIETTGFNRLYSRIKRDAKRRDNEFDLSKDDVEKLVQRPCYYCGVQPKQICGKGKGSILYNGIDRVDNDKGYLKDNVVTCCKHCNYAKRTMSPERFYELVRKVYKHFVAKPLQEVVENA